MGRGTDTMSQIYKAILRGRRDYIRARGCATGLRPRSGRPLEDGRRQSRSARPQYQPLRKVRPARRHQAGRSHPHRLHAAERPSLYVSAAPGPRSHRDRQRQAAAHAAAKQGRNKPTIACEPMVSSLTEVAKFAPARPLRDLIRMALPMGNPLVRRKGDRSRPLDPLSPIALYPGGPGLILDRVNA